ncbi:MAG TPA: deoxyribonuclease V [Candidatus Acidoferrales bacterium]|nr:deoxyribonuclease V [Candidatus Acidoferrales bacterium]
MKALRLHSWKVTPKEAVQVQLRLRDRVEVSDRFGKICKVAGADIALDLERKIAVAGVIVYSYPEMKEIERVWAKRPLTFPYVPGLLSFREIPTLTAAFAKLKNRPDLVFVDGHGFAHPRRVGIASHLGMVLDCPTVGCAKSVLCGEAEEPADEFGAVSELEHKEEVIAIALRSRVGCKPIYISTGHRVSLESAVRFALSVLDGLRVPRPTREADRFVGKMKQIDALKCAKKALKGTKWREVRRKIA